MVSPSTNPAFSIIPKDGSKKTKKKRVRVFTASDRANHRTIEKQRREALNQRFLELARLLPALASVRRLSKAVIVKESTAYLQELRSVRLTATQDVRGLISERDTLTEEVNFWRRQRYGPQADLHRAMPVSKGILELFAVEDEEFGSFPGGFGDNSLMEEQDEDQTGPQDYTEYVSPIEGIDLSVNVAAESMQTHGIVNNAQGLQHSAAMDQSPQSSTSIQVSMVLPNSVPEELPVSASQSLSMAPLIGFASSLDTIPDPTPTGNYTHLLTDSTSLPGDLGGFASQLNEPDSSSYSNDAMPFFSEGIQGLNGHDRIQAYQEYPMNIMPHNTLQNIRRGSQIILDHQFPMNVNGAAFGQI